MRKYLSLKSTEIMNCLKILPVDELVLHEEVDDKRVDKLISEFNNSNLFYNPILVAKIPGLEKYFVIDGATRTTSFRKMGIKHILVQIVNYLDDQVLLKTWSLALKSDPRVGIDKVLELFEKKENFLFSHVVSRNTKNLFIYHLKDNKKYSVKINEDIEDKCRFISKLSKKIYKLGKIQRILLENGSSISYLDNEGYNYLFCFPMFKKDEIIKLIKKKLLLPAGITRHIVSGRILNLRFPLKIFNGSDTLESKNKKLKIFIEKSLKERAFRLYEEAVFVLEG